MSKTSKQHLFELWLDGSLDHAQQHEFENYCLRDPDFAARVQSVEAVHQITAQHIDIRPPRWDKDSTFTMQRHRWWQWGGWPVTSFAFSMVAVAMVVTGFNVDYSHGRLSLGFANGVSEQHVEQLVEQRLADLQSENQALFNQYITAIQQQQATANAQLTSYLLTSNRQERREDFAELVKLINQQRYDDQVFYVRQLNDLQREISAKTGLPIDSVIPVSNIYLDE